MEQHPSSIPEFLRDARPNTEQMRLVAQSFSMALRSKAENSAKSLRALN